MLTRTEFHEITGAIKYIKANSMTYVPDILQMLETYVEEPVVHKKSYKKAKLKFKCGNCGQRFADDSHQDDDEDDDLCVRCHAIENDEDLDEPEDDEDVVCDSCGVCLGSANIHIQSDEKDEPLCKKCFDDIQPDAMDKFMEQENKKGEDDYKCHTCRKMLTLEQCYFVDDDSGKESDIPFCKGCGPDKFRTMFPKKKLAKNLRRKVKS